MFMATNRFPPVKDFLDFTTNPERDAYFLGFFYADGYNYEKGGRLVISLALKDELFLQELSYSIHQTIRPLNYWNSRSHPIASMSISSRFLSKRVADLGAPQCKTHILKWPTFLSPKLERHFIRGYFDGDGSCLHSKHKKYELLNRAIHFPGTLDFLTGLQSSILKYTNLNSGIIKLGNIFLLHLGGNRKSLQFLEWLYQDCKYYMPRKRNRYILLKTEMQKLDERNTMVFQDNQTGLWYGRLPNKYKRKGTGIGYTKEEALSKWKNAMETIKQTSYEEWFKNRPPQRKRGQTRKHVKEQGLAEGRYLRKNKKIKVT